MFLDSLYLILYNLIRDALKHVTRIDKSTKYLIKYLIQSADAAIKLVIEMKSSLHSCMQQHFLKSLKQNALIYSTVTQRCFHKQHLYNSRISSQWKVFITLISWSLYVKRTN